MMVGEDFILADDETRTEEIFANFRGAALEAVDHVAVAVLEGLAVGIDRAVTQRTMRALVKKGNGDVEKADAGSVGSNDAFGGVRLSFYFFQPAGGLIQLFAEAGDFAGVRGGEFLAKIVRLFLKPSFLLGDVRLH